MTEERAKLEPCPFCGGEAKRMTLGPNDSPDMDGGDVIVCTGKCGCSSHVEFGFKENLVSLWNTRVSPRPAAPEEREAIADLIDKHVSGPDLRSDGGELAQAHRQDQLIAADRILALRPTGSDGWEPIETAPKDGTDILAWCIHPNAEYASTVAEKSDWQAPVVARWIDHNGGGWTWHGLCGRFTHWRSLPVPPLRSAGGEG